jgi:hypothetical protein
MDSRISLVLLKARDTLAILLMLSCPIWANILTKCLFSSTSEHWGGRFVTVTVYTDAFTAAIDR